MNNTINPVSAGTYTALEGKADLVINKVKKPAADVITGRKEFVIDSSFDKNAVDKTVDEINAQLVRNDKQLEYSFHEKTNTMVVKIVETSTGETIKEIPNTKLLDMAASVWEQFGLIVDEKA